LTEEELATTISQTEQVDEWAVSSEAETADIQHYQAIY